MAALGGSQTCGSGLKPAPAEPHHGDKDDAERSVRVDQPVDQKRVQQVLSTVRRKQEELVQHQDAWEQLASMLDALVRADRKPCEVLCLGVGTLETTSAQYQLALLLELRDRLAQCINEAHADDEGLRTTIFDPLFGPLDVAVASQLDMRLPTENLCGGYSLPRPTFVYMPHCPRELYEALLRANWTHDALARIVLCGNDLSAYALTGGDRSTFTCLLRAAECVSSCTLPHFPTAAAGALDGAMQCFLSPAGIWDAVHREQAEDEGWNYRPAMRKSRPRRRRGASSSPDVAALTPADDAFWELPTGPLPSGPEVLAMPIHG